MSDFDFVEFDPFSVPDDAEVETNRQLKEPLRHERRAQKRSFISGLKREALTDLIPTLPPPDTDLFVIGNGAGAETKHGINPSAFDFGSYIPHVVRQLGDKDCTAWVSTWTLNRTHAQSMLQMLKDGRLERLTVFTDPYFQRRTASIANELITGLLASGKGVYLAFKNHVKCIAIQSPDGRTCVITGSANLSAQPRAEQYHLSTSPDVYDFFVNSFFKEMIKRAE